MNHISVSFVRIFYTISLLLAGIVIVVFFIMAHYQLSKSGQGNFIDLLGQPGTILILLPFLLLLSSRILSSRSSYWFLLGLPTILLMYGWIGYLFLARFFYH